MRDRSFRVLPNENSKSCIVICTDFMSFDSTNAGEVDLVIAAGVLQHASSRADLENQL